ncbi:MAG: hypothetical protein U9R52_01125 [Candidatus Omnitrophota bacterium]|nr:hypothetical protein [Candidatus Omnitrophota bacterium]
MIKINLLPEESKKKRMKIEFPDIAFLPIIAGLLGIIVAVHLLLGLTAALKTRTLKRLQSEWGNILPDKEKADELKLELAGMRSRIKAIEELIEGRFGWAKKLNDLSDAMLAGVWLNRLWLEEKAASRAKALHLNGSVFAAGGDETAAVGKFIRSLEANKGFFYNFNDLETASIQRRKLKESEVMDFELICYFK